MHRPRWFGHPLIPIAILAALCLDFWSIDTSTRYTQSTIKQAVLNAAFGPPFPPLSGALPPSDAVFYMRHDVLVLHWKYTHPDIPIDLMRFPPNNSSRGWNLVGTMYGPEARITGFYHPTQQHTTIRFSAWYDDPSEARLRALYVEAFDALPGPISTTIEGRALAHARTLCATSQNTGTIPLPSGYLRNALTLTLLTVLVAMPILGRTDLWLATLSTRIVRRPKPWQCQTCGYDVRGLRQCPECGTKKTPASD